MRSARHLELVVEDVDGVMVGVVHTVEGERVPEYPLSSVPHTRRDCAMQSASASGLSMSVVEWLAKMSAHFGRFDGVAPTTCAKNGWEQSAEITLGLSTALQTRVIRLPENGVQRDGLTDWD